MSKMRAIAFQMMNAIFNNRYFSYEDKEREVKKLNLRSGGVLFGSNLMSSPYNQRQKRKRMRQMPHKYKK